MIDSSGCRTPRISVQCIFRHLPVQKMAREEASVGRLGGRKFICTVGKFYPGVRTVLKCSNKLSPPLINIFLQTGGRRLRGRKRCGLRKPARGVEGLQRAPGGGSMFISLPRVNSFASMPRGLHSDALSSFFVAYALCRVVTPRCEAGDNVQGTSQPERPGAARHAGEPYDGPTYAHARKIHAGRPRGQCFPTHPSCVPIWSR